MLVAGLPSGERLPNAPPRAAARIVVVKQAERKGRVPSNEEFCRLMRSIALDGDRAAFSELFGHFAPRVKALLMRYGLQEPLSEELAQETMVTVWRKAGRFDPGRGSVSTWIFTIARNKRIDCLRKDRGREEEPLALSDGAGICASGEEFAIAAETAEQVRTAVAALRGEQAAIVRLSFFAEKPHAEIARELGIPLGTVKSRVRLALARLRVMLEGQL